MGTKKRYRNPNGPGYLLLSDERARRMGLLEELDTPAPSTSSSRRSSVPKGALAPGGPTARARAKAAAEAAKAAEDEESSGTEEPLEPAEPARQKKQDQPTAGTRRRRPAAPKTGGK